jgi:pimeloyl-ACP methyl ester carboxylesterase
MSATTATELTQLTAPNQSVEDANGITYAYRRFGNAESDAPPLLFLQHFRGNLDNWDPALVDAIAAQREVILFDNAGVGGSAGAVPRTFTAMAYDALAFIDAGPTTSSRTPRSTSPAAMTSWRCSSSAARRASPRAGSSSAASSPGPRTATPRPRSRSAMPSSTPTPRGASRTPAGSTGSPASRSPCSSPTATTTA